MEQNLKELLLRDLCARLPYGVEVYYSETVPISTLKTINSEKGTCIVYDHSQWYRHSKFHIEEIKPYLRSMSSMTEEEYEDLCNSCTWLWFKNDLRTVTHGDYKCYDWLNSHHFDYRGLIEKGLALEASKDMYNIKEK